MRLPVVPVEVARRLLLGGQGLLDDPTRKATTARAHQLIETMGFVQVDSINIVARAHHLILGSRLDGYRPELLTTLIEERRSLFEHWTHDAAAIPSKWFPHWRHRFERDRVRLEENKWWKERLGDDWPSRAALIEARIRDHGPVLAKDFEDQRPGQEPGGWWAWKPEKAVLEHLWRTGRLAIARRDNFQKVYDLTERVLGDHCHTPAPELDAHIRWAAETAMDRLGVATPAELAGFWHAIDIATARRWCLSEVAKGSLLEVEVEAVSGKRQRAYALADWKRKARRLADPPDRLRLLCPFDPILRDRKRCERLFGFDYRFEAFVPAKKRRYGYYVLPILEGERLIGRADLKTNRDRGALEVRGLWWEPKVKPTKARKQRLDEALERLARLAGVER